MIEFLGAKPVPIPLSRAAVSLSTSNVLRGQALDKDQAGDSQLAANPTGGSIPGQDLTQIADMLRDRDLIVLSDEIYSRIFYGEAARRRSRASTVCWKRPSSSTDFQDVFDDRLASGLRRDADWLADAVSKLMVNSNSCTASFTQRAGIAALHGPQDAVNGWSPSSAAAATPL